MDALPESWRRAVGSETDEPYFARLREFLERERALHEVYPAERDLFAALERTPFDDVRVLLLGQDPYHAEGQAHGLAFSVRPGVRPPPSLVNIFRELESDVGCPRPANGSLVQWAERGVLLLNTVLTVRAHTPNSHRGIGWERFTDAVIRALSARERPLAFMLWGGAAGQKVDLVDASRHAVVCAPHPSPLSAYRGFFGCRPFTAANDALRALGQPEIDWCLPSA